MRIEWSQHLFSHWVDWFPFAHDAPYRPQGDTLRFPVQTYLSSLAERGIDMGIIVQPEPYGQDHRLLLYSLALEQQRLLAACLFLPGDPQAVEKLQQMVCAEPRIIAQRFHAFRGRKPYFASWQDEAVQSLWRTAGRLGLVIELHISPDQAAELAGVFERYPEYPVVIDHLGEPGLGSAPEFTDVLALARYPQIIVKLSALERLEHEIGRGNLTALVQRVLDAYGVERLVWGGGTLEALDRLLNGLSPAERDKIKGSNLERILHLEH